MVATNRPHVQGIPIDAAHTKDVDDAVWVEKTLNGWSVIVSITDVASEIAVGSSLDISAREKGFTNYAPSPIEPMFPFLLSEGSLSLLEGTTRPTLSFFLEMDDQLNLTAARVNFRIATPFSCISYVTYARNVT